MAHLNKNKSGSLSESILNCIGEAIFVHHPQTGIIEDVNDTMLQMYGYEKHEVVGKTVAMLSDLESGFTNEKAYEKIKSAETGNVELFEWKAKRKDGSTFWVEVSLKFADYSGAKHVVAVVRNIEEKKKNESILEKYSVFPKLIAELSTKFISLPIADFDKEIDDALETLGKLMESDRAYIFIYSTDYKFMSNTHEWCEKGIQAYKDDLQEIPADYFLWNHKQLIKGKTIRVDKVSELGDDAAHEKAEFEKEGIQSLLIVPFVHNNQILGFIGVDFVNLQRNFYKDDEIELKAFGNIIGQALVRKGYEQSIKEAQQKAEENDRLKSAFLSNMSHEIRTPMNGIIGFSELLATQNLGTQERLKYIKIINESGQQLLSIIDDIVDISKIEAGQIQLNPEPLNIFDELENVMQVFIPIARHKKIALEYSQTDKSTSNHNILIDKTKIKQIFNNLIGNAIKYTSEGFVKINLKIENNNLIFSVLDSGIGIGIEAQKQIFDRFVREDNEFTRAIGGNGLGLAITNGFVQKMGGQIKLKSEINKGSEFLVIIPLQA